MTPGPLFKCVAHSVPYINVPPPSESAFVSHNVLNFISHVHIQRRVLWYFSRNRFFSPVIWKLKIPVVLCQVPLPAGPSCWPSLITVLTVNSRSLGVLLLLASRALFHVVCCDNPEPCTHWKVLYHWAVPSPSLHVVFYPLLPPWSLGPVALNHTCYTFSACLLLKFRFLWVFPTHVLSFCVLAQFSYYYAPWWGFCVVQPSLVTSDKTLLFSVLGCASEFIEKRFYFFNRLDKWLLQSKQAASLRCSSFGTLNIRPGPR